MNIGLYGMAQVANAALALILIGLLTRTLGRAGFGEFSFAFVVASLGAMFADFGLGPWLTRAVSRNASQAGPLLDRVLSIRFPLLIASAALLLAVMSIYLDSVDRLWTLALMIGYVSGLGYSMIYESALMGRQDVRGVSTALLAGKVLEITMVLLVMLLAPAWGPTAAAAAMATAAGFRVVVVRMLVSRAIRGDAPTPLPPESSGMWQVLGGTFPFAAGLILWMIYSKIDVLLLERMVPTDQLGVYTAAYRVVEALFLIPRSVVGVNFPIFADAWTRDKLDSRLEAAPLRLLLAGALTATTTLVILPEDSLRLLFGNTFSIGAGALRILGLALLPLFLNQYQAMYLGATDRQVVWIRRLAIALVGNLLLNLILIPRFGIEGAAVATLISETALLASFVASDHARLARILSISWIGRLLLATALLAAALAIVPGPLPWRIALAITLFAGAGIGLRIIDPGFLRIFRTDTTDPPSPIDATSLGEPKNMPPTPALSVVILAFNSSATLSATLESVHGAGEILVIDSGSSDDTVDIARRYGASVATRRLTEGWAAQRNFGLDLARGSWILAIDSDEILDTELAAAIAEVARSPMDLPRPGGYSIRVLNYFLGRPLRHGGLERDDHVRLIRRGAGRWIGDVHEVLEVAGPIGVLPGLVHHHTGATIEERLSKIARYARLRSRQWCNEGRRPSAARTIWEPIRFLLGRLVIRGGWRDGLHGFLWWWLQATELLVANFLITVEGLCPPEAEPKISDRTTNEPRPESHVGN
ncbi:MAG: oligosaccharide flippase family protein [Candidatus Eisenbacteria bacterium]|nr:oligosaccharide flippase family protein [Candidatus Eisenbacteria bacterium]